MVNSKYLAFELAYESGYVLYMRNIKRHIIAVSEWVNWLFNVTINDNSVIYVTAHRCAGGLKKKLDIRSGTHAIDIS